MEYMESMIQAQYDAFDAKLKHYADAANEIEQVLKKHDMDHADLEFIAQMLENGY